MKSKKSVLFLIVILAIGILGYIAFDSTAFGGIIPGADDIRTGIDIRGGVHALLYAVKTDGTNPSEEELESARAIIGLRLDSKGILDRVLTVDKINGRLVVDIPWQPGEKDFNPSKAIAEIGRVGLLTFQEVDEELKDDAGNYKPTGKIVLKGDQVEDAGVSTNPNTGQIVVTLDLNDSGTKDFSDATARLVGKKIAIFMDEDLIIAPTVDEQISGGSAIITGQRTAKEAGELAAIIDAGALPFKLEIREVNSITPTLGEGALNVAINAGIISFILVFLFMLFIYRLPGLLASIALFGLAVIQLLLISWLNITLTLPGIAGIVLSLGMGVDANIVIFERIKEELRYGKTLGASADLGFKRAFVAIFDSNVTTVIAGAVLILFGTGAIKGFGITLCLGVLLSFFTAITASRIMLRTVTSIDTFRNPWFYGIKGVKQDG